VQQRVERPHRKLDAHLVVPFSGATVSHRIGREALRRFHQERRNERARKRGRERIDTLIQRIRVERGPYVPFHESIARIDHDRVVRSKGQRLRAHGFQLRGWITARRTGLQRRRSIAFAKIRGHGDHLVPVENQFLEQHRGIQPARVS